jgi:hypothetical protein
VGFDLEAGYCAALSERIIDPLRQLAVSEVRRFRRSAMPHGKPFGLEVDDFEACLKLVLRKVKRSTQEPSKPDKEERL